MSSNSILPEKVISNYSNDIAFIRRCAKMNKIRISNHCYKMISQRKIKLADVYDSIKNGEVIEIQDLERDVKILFQDSVNKPPSFFVVVAIKPTYGLCVTAYLPDEDKWILDENNQWRRK